MEAPRIGQIVAGKILDQDHVGHQAGATLEPFEQIVTE